MPRTVHSIRRRSPNPTDRPKIQENGKGIRRHAKTCKGKECSGRRFRVSTTKAHKQIFHHIRSRSIKVIKVNCSQIVFEDKDGKTHCRNSAHVKKIHYPNGRSQLTKKLRRVQVRQMQRVVQGQQRHQTKHLKPSNSRNTSNPIRHEDQTESENHQTITKRITKEH